MKIVSTLAAIGLVWFGPRTLASARPDDPRPRQARSIESPCESLLLADRLAESTYDLDQDSGGGEDFGFERDAIYSGDY